MPTAALLSFRFSPTDGVSVVSRRWADVLGGLGFDVVTVAATGADRLVDGIGLDTTTRPDADALRLALADADLVVVENLCTIPLNVPAALLTAEILRGRPAVMHHHDPPWHRARYHHVTELPVDDASWAHVSITDTAADELRARGIDSTVIYNGFEAPDIGDRVGTRARLGVSPSELLVAHPVRAIERKNVPAALRLAEQLGGTYWLLGPAEEDYGPTLARVLAEATCRVIHEPSGQIDDIYAAADLVAYPSSWEGFGNPPIEAALRRRPVAVGDYPFAGELRRLGFGFFEPADVDGIRSFLDAPDAALLGSNEELAAALFSIERVEQGVRGLLDEQGWLP